MSERKGVGDRIAEKFHQYGIRSSAGCSCQDIAAKLNSEPAAWCRANIDWILEKIRENSKKKGIPFVELVVRQIVEQAISDQEGVDALIETSKRRTFEAMVQDVKNDVARGERVRDPHWSFRPEVVEAHRQMFARSISAIMSEERTNTFPGAGRGIVTLIGTTKYFPAGYVLCRMLRSIGCTLPIEAWYLGRVELDHRMEELLQELGVRCVDATQQHVAWEPRTLGGWQCKARAIAGSEFDEVLFLDSDQVPVQNPEHFFDEVKNIDVVAWPDFKNQWGYDCCSVAWEVLGLPVPGRSVDIPNHTKPTDYTPWETGQMFVRKSKAWRYLQAAILFSDHSDWWYPKPHGRSMWPVYGDKSTFLFAALATKQPVAMAQDTTLFGGKEGGGFDQYDLHGHLLFQHRCQPTSKIRLTGMNASTGLVRANLFSESIEELKAKWKPKIWSWDDQSADDSRRAEKECGEYFAHGGPFGSARVTLKKGGEISGVNGLHWRIITVDGRNILIVSNAYMAVAVCEEYENGWIDRERNVSLQHTAPADWEGIDSLSVAHIWTDVYLKNEYRLPDDMLGMTVLDIGGHEGIFARACLDRGAGAVVSVEPHPDNFVRLTKNLGHESRSLRINAAVHGSAPYSLAVTLELPDSGATSSGGFKIMQAGNRQHGKCVPAMSSHDVLQISKSFCFQSEDHNTIATIGPIPVDHKIDLLKLDCEGSEWPILIPYGRRDGDTPECSWLGNFNYVCAEIHTAWLWKFDDKYGIPKNSDDAMKLLGRILECKEFSYWIKSTPEQNLFHLWAWRRELPCIFKDVE